MQGPGRGLRALGIRILHAALAATACVLASAQTAAAQGPGPEPPGRAWLLVDAADGEVLASRAPGRQASIASTTKLMTAYVARRELRLGEEVVAPPYQAAAAESLLGLDAGERIEARDLLTGLLLASGNDAAVALAEASAGSVDRFVARMNRTARQLGLEGTSYSNPIGLDEPDNFSTPEDLVTLTRELREDPFLRRTIDLPEATLSSGATSRQVINRNVLVRTVGWVDGVKTGYTLDAGYVLVGSGTRRDITLVSVLLGAPSEAARDAGTLELLRYGFSLYRREQAVRRGEEVATASVRYRDQPLPLLAGRELSLTVRDGERIDTDVRVPAEVEGPVSRGARVGEVVISVDGEERGAVPLIAADVIPPATLLDRFDGRVPGPRAVAWAVAIAALAAVFGAILAAFDRWRGRRQPGDRR